MNSLITTLLASHIPHSAFRIPHLMAGWIGFPFIPERASGYAGQVDRFFFFMVAVSGVLSLGIAFFIVLFSVRYRKGSRANRVLDHSPAAKRRHMAIEIAWSVIPLIIVLIMFTWGAILFYRVSSPPADAMNIAVTAKQWMWKFQHPDGRREIDVLHVPVGQSIKLSMTSEDVIHSFYVPAFRVKQDVLPDRYTTTWFRPEKPGTYHLFCAEYCGTNHSLMRGSVVVMEPAEYQRWLTQGTTGQSLARQGELAFMQYGCSGCHAPPPGSPRQGPLLNGLFGRLVVLADGSTVVADRQYIHDSIVLPLKQVVTGFQPVMPTFKGVLSEDQVNALIEYIKTLGRDGATAEAKK